MIKQIRFRRGTTAEWAEANPVLALGEPGFEIDTSLIKVGDGTRAWVDLPYGQGEGPSGVTDYNELENLPELGTAAAASTGDFATAAQGELADSALQPDDGLAAIDASAASKLGGIETGAEVNTVATVNGQTGAVSLSYSDVGAASAAQGELADSAVQPDDLDDPESAASMNLSSQFVLLGDGDRVDGQVPVWDADAGEWVSGPGGGGEQGPPGAGVPDGGTTGQVLAKKSESNQDTEWVNPPEGGSGGGPVDWGDVEGKPSFADVATSGDYDDLEGKPTLGSAAAAATGDFATAEQGGLAATALQPDDGLAAIDSAAATKLGTIAEGAEVNVQSDWNAGSGDAHILNKPTLGSAAASSTGDFATATQGSKADSAVQPDALAAVATSGAYDDLDNKPSIPDAQVQSDWDASSGLGQILNKPTLGTAAAAATGDFATATQGGKADSAVQPDELAAVATSGDYADLENKPSIPSAQVQSDWNASSGLGQILNKPTLGTAAAAATSDFATAEQGGLAATALQPADGLSAIDSAAASKLSGIETGAEVNVQSDWNAGSGDAHILNKPSIPDAQVPADWNAGSGPSQVLNKPSLGSAASAASGDFATASQGELADTAFQPGSTIELEDSDADHFGQVRIHRDGTETSSWPDRFTFWVETATDSGTFRRTFYLNEYGEIRQAPGASNTTPFRVFQREYTSQPSRDMSVPLIEVMDNRDDRNSLFRVMPDGSVESPKITARRDLALPSDPGGGTGHSNALERITLGYTPDGQDSPDIESVQANGSVVSWRNEWGALRGTSPYNWGDALVRAVKNPGSTINSGNAIELDDRDKEGAARNLWARRWIDGNLVRHGNVMADCYVCDEGDSDGDIEALGLPNGTIVIEILD